MDNESTEGQREINLLVLGETGVGKSTWINSFANYLAYDSLEEAENGQLQVVIPTSFSITDDDYKVRTITTGTDGNEVLRAGESATQKPRTYCLQYNDYIVRIIDTPGIGDSRGPQQDKINFQMIMDHLAQYNEVHGICILLKPNNARITVLFEFCIKHLLTHLHRDSIKNIVFCFTNARNTFYRPGNTLPALMTLLEKFQDLIIPLDKSTMYCLDNESIQYLAAVKEGLNFDDQRDVYAKSWELSSKETHRLLDRIIAVEPHKLQNTVTLNDTRRIVLELTKPLADIGNNIQKNIQKVKEKEKEVNQLKNDRKTIKGMDLFIPVVTFNYTQLPKALRVCNNKKCYKEIKLENGETMKKHKCQKPKSTGWSFGLFKAKNCPRCGCPKEQHIDIFYEITEGLKQEKCVELEASLLQLDESIENIKAAFLNTTTKRIKDLEEEQQKIIEICSKFANFLKTNAIAPYNDTMVMYLDQKIETVKLDKSPSTAKMLNDLETMRREYVKEVQVLEQRMMQSSQHSSVQCYEIPLLKDELIGLPLSGKNIKDVLEKQENRHGSMIEEKIVDIKPKPRGRARRSDDVKPVKTLAKGPKSLNIIGSLVSAFGSKPSKPKVSSSTEKEEIPKQKNLVKQDSNVDISDNSVHEPENVASQVVTSKPPVKPRTPQPPHKPTPGSTVSSFDSDRPNIPCPRMINPERVRVEEMKTSVVTPGPPAPPPPPMPAISPISEQMPPMLANQERQNLLEDIRKGVQLRKSNSCIENGTKSGNNIVKSSQSFDHPRAGAQTFTAALAKEIAKRYVANNDDSDDDWD